MSWLPITIARRRHLTVTVAARRPAITGTAAALRPRRPLLIAIAVTAF